MTRTPYSAIDADYTRLDMHDGWVMDVTVDDRGITLYHLSKTITIPLADVQPLIEYILFDSPYRAFLDLHHPVAATPDTALWRDNVDSDEQEER